MQEENKNQHKNDPLHGKTLKMILEEMVEQYGWEVMAKRVNIKCFAKDPSVKSSLTFLRKHEWAREKVEEIYIMGIQGINK